MVQFCLKLDANGPVPLVQSVPELAIHCHVVPHLRYNTGNISTRAEVISHLADLHYIANVPRSEKTKDPQIHLIWNALLENAVSIISDGGLSFLLELNGFQVRIGEAFRISRWWGKIYTK